VARKSCRCMYQTATMFVPTSRIPIFFTQYFTHSDDARVRRRRDRVQRHPPDPHDLLNLNFSWNTRRRRAGRTAAIRPNVTTGTIMLRRRTPCRHRSRFHHSRRAAHVRRAFEVPLRWLTWPDIRSAPLPVRRRCRSAPSLRRAYGTSRTRPGAPSTEDDPVT